MAAESATGAADATLATLLLAQGLGPLGAGLASVLESGPAGQELVVNLAGSVAGAAELDRADASASSFGEIANADIGFGLPVSFLYGVVLALVIAYVMRYTALGRHMSFVGANREVARLAGVRVSRIRIGAYEVGGNLQT